MFIKKTKQNNALLKVPKYLVTAFLFLLVNMQTAMASSFGQNIDKNGAANEGIGDLNNDLASLLSYAGAVVIVLGVIKLVLSVKEEDAGSKVQAFMVIVGGVVFMMAKAIVQAI